MAKKSDRKASAGKKSVAKDKGDSKLFAFLATFLTIIGFIIALATKRDDEYVMFYAKQGLVLFVIQVIASVLAAIPILGWFFIGPVVWVLFIVVWIMAWINALSGEKRSTWLIGEFAEKIRL